MEEVIGEESRSNVRIQLVDFVEHTGSRTYPMGLLYISAVLKDRGFSNIKLAEHCCMAREIARNEQDGGSIARLKESYLSGLLSYMATREPHLILLGPITSMALVELVDLVPRLRETLPDSVIIAGGPHFGQDESMDDELLGNACTGLDGVIVGEAEDTIAEVTELYFRELGCEKGNAARERFVQSMKDIAGVKTSNGRFVPRQTPDIERTPFPDMKLVNDHEDSHWIWTTSRRFSLSERRNPLLGTEAVPVDAGDDWGATFEDLHYFDEFSPPYSMLPFGILIGSRGCPYACRFCASSGKRRIRSAESIFGEMSRLYREDWARLFVFFDPLFTTASSEEQQRVDKLCTLILDSGMDIRYIIDIRADVVLKLRSDLIGKMFRSGCVELNLGLEKGSNRALRRIVKRSRIEEHFEAISRLREISREVGREILINGTFILGGSGEQKSDVMDTLIHGFMLDLDGFIFYPLEIHPGTQTYRDAVREGIIETGLTPYLVPETYPTYATPDLSRTWLEKISRVSRATIDSLRELRNAILNVEKDLTEAMGENLRKKGGYSTGNAYETVRVFIEKATSFVNRRPGERLFLHGSLREEIKAYADAAESKFNQLEALLKREFEDPKSSVDHWSPRRMMRLWRRFVKHLDFLFGFQRNAQVLSPRGRDSPPSFSLWRFISEFEGGSSISNYL